MSECHSTAFYAHGCYVTSMSKNDDDDDDDDGGGGGGGGGDDDDDDDKFYSCFDVFSWR